MEEEMEFAMGSPGGKDETRMKMSGAIYAKCIRTFNFISCVRPADYTYLEISGCRSGAAAPRAIFEFRLFH